jgi:hypothetical protein
MAPLLAQKAGLDGKVKVFVLYVEPINDMIDGQTLDFSWR